MQPGNACLRKAMRSNSVLLPFERLSQSDRCQRHRCYVPAPDGPCRQCQAIERSGERKTYHYRKHFSRTYLDGNIVDKFYVLSPAASASGYLVAEVRIRKNGTMSGCFSCRHDDESLSCAAINSLEIATPVGVGGKNGRKYCKQTVLKPSLLTECLY